VIEEQAIEEDLVGVLERFAGRYAARGLLLSLVGLVCACCLAVRDFRPARAEVRAGRARPSSSVNADPLFRPAVQDSMHEKRLRAVSSSLVPLSSITGLQPLGVRPTYDGERKSRTGRRWARFRCHDERVELMFSHAAPSCVICGRDRQGADLQLLSGSSASSVGSFSGSPGSAMVRSKLSAPVPASSGRSAPVRESLSASMEAPSRQRLSPSSGTKRQRTSVTLSARSMKLERVNAVVGAGGIARGRVVVGETCLARLSG